MKSKLSGYFSNARLQPSNKMKTFTHTHTHTKPILTTKKENEKKTENEKRDTKSERIYINEKFNLSF